MSTTKDKKELLVMTVQIGKYKTVAELPDGYTNEDVAWTAKYILSELQRVTAGDKS